MRVAIISDIHGNIVALDAVLADCSARGVDTFWFVGDYAAIGPEPAAVLERVTALANASFIRGNTDRYVTSTDRPPPTLETARSNPDLISKYGAVAASLNWTSGFLTASGWFDWVAQLPLEMRFTAPDGTRILVVHASPGTDDGEGVHPGRSNIELTELFAGCEADLIFVGHTHEPMVRRVGSVVVVNPGSVSNPRSGDARASYVIADISESGIELEHHRVAYDYDAFAARVKRSHHPAAGFILSHQRGEQRGRTPHADHTPLQPGEKVRSTI